MPKQYTKHDIPTPPDMAEYLARVAAVWEVFPGLPGLPALPTDMDALTFQEANDLERILERVGAAAENIGKSRVYAGEIYSGGF